MGLLARVTAAATVVVCGAALAGCTDTDEPRPEPVTLEWREVSLPGPPDGQRIVLGGGAVCDGHWYLVGAHDRIGEGPDEEWLGTDDTLDPAAWTSLDGETWTTLPVSAHSYYGIRSLLWSAACRDGQVVALGGKVGGAHGNPRMASYYPVPTPGVAPVLTEIDASFELYGGPKATNVGRMTAGPPGYLIVGNRSAGAAVWLSPDGAAFEIVEGAPGLARTAALGTWAADAAFHGDAWVVVGSVVVAGRADRDPAAWRSPDGRHWTAIEAESAPDYDELSVVASASGSLTAIGNHGETFQAWRLEADGWRASGRFGSTRVEPVDGQLTSAVPVGLEAAGVSLLAVVKAGWDYQLWTSDDGGESWRQVMPPIKLPAASGGQRAVIIGVPGAGSAPDRLLLVTDDGSEAHAFLADAPARGAG